MQEKTDPVFVVATANDIQSLPPELLRKGRFDEIFFVDLPTTREREKIFEIHINKRLITEKVKGHLEVNETLLRKLADLSEGFIGAEIEQAVITGLFEAYSNDRSLLSEDIEKAIKQTVPLSVTQAEEIRSLREWANVRAVTATLQDDRVNYENETGDQPDTFTDIHRSRGGRALDF